MTAIVAPWRACHRAWAFGLVALVHAGLIALFARTVTPVEPPVEPVMLIEMAPVPAPDRLNEPAAAQPNLKDPAQPALDQPPPEHSVPEPVQVAESQVVEPESPRVPQVAKPEPPVEPRVLQPEPPEALPAPPSLPITPPPEARNPPVVAPRRVTAAPRSRQTRLEIAPGPREAKPSAPPEAASAPAATPAASVNVPLSWQSRLLAHLNHYKRFPAEARMRRLQGTALVHLNVMPDGSAALVRLQSSSGSDALDQEALALITRAQPLPVPDGTTFAIDIAVPIQFTIR